MASSSNIERTSAAVQPQPSRLRRILTQFWLQKWLFVLLLPGLLFFIVYVYIPLLGNIIAFQDYSPFLGFANSPWVGLKHFERLFSDPQVRQVLVNTVVLSLLQIMIVFPIPIVLALMLNEVRHALFKRSIQSIIYLPHFISWVIIVGIWYQLFGNQGIVNELLVQMGIDRVNFVTSADWFRPMFILQNIWKESGWGTIIFLAALTSINTELYEAAAIDGASRWQRIRFITLPGIQQIIFIVLILRLGHVLTLGFEHIFLLLNSSTESVAQVLETYVYYRGILNGNFSFATAVGLVQGIVGLVLVLGTNWIARRTTDQGGLF